MVDEGNNQGLQVVVKTLGGSQVDMKLVRFASGRNHHQSKQPMLVVFTDDGRRSTTLEGKGRKRGGAKQIIFIFILLLLWEHTFIFSSGAV